MAKVEINANNGVYKTMLINGVEVDGVVSVEVANITPTNPICSVTITLTDVELSFKSAESISRGG